MEYRDTTERLPKLVVKFSGLDHYPSELLIAGLELVENALHDLEESTLTTALTGSDLEQHVYAVKAELDKLRGRHLQVFDAQRGCIELTAVMGATALWVLQLTVGESMKAAYKETSLHEKVTAVFSTDVVALADKLRSSVNKALRTAKRNASFVVALSRVDVQVHADPSDMYRKVHISFAARSNYDNVPSELLPPLRR